MSEVPKEVFSVKEVALYLGLSESTVRGLIRWNEIPYIKVRRRYLFYKERINQWLLASSTDPTPAGAEDRIAESTAQRVIRDIRK